MLGACCLKLAQPNTPESNSPVLSGPRGAPEPKGEGLGGQLRPGKEATLRPTKIKKKQELDADLFFQSIRVEASLN